MLCVPMPLPFASEQMLARRPGHVVRYQALMEAAEQGIVTRNTVNTHILHLRRKLRSVDPGFAGIRNEYALGYRWSDL